MIKFRLFTPREFRLTEMSVEEAFVFLPTTNPHVDVPICFEGPEKLLKEIKENLFQSYGERGRHINEETSAYDLNNAMHQGPMACFDPEWVEGRDLLQAGTSD